MLQETAPHIYPMMQSSLIFGGWTLLGGPEFGGTGLSIPIWLQLSRTSSRDKSRNMSVAVEAETEAPSLHDLVTKKEEDGFVWDHQFTVSKIHCRMSNFYWFRWWLVSAVLPWSLYSWKLEGKIRNENTFFFIINLQACLYGCEKRRHKGRNLNVNLVFTILVHITIYLSPNVLLSLLLNIFYLSSFSWINSTYIPQRRLLDLVNLRIRRRQLNIYKYNSRLWIDLVINPVTRLKAKYSLS